MADHWKGACMYTSPENFFSMESPLAKVMQMPFYPYSADAWDQPSSYDCSCSLMPAEDTTTPDQL